MLLRRSRQPCCAALSPNACRSAATAPCRRWWRASLLALHRSAEKRRCPAHASNSRRAAADALDQWHPLAATLMLRGMIGFSLDRARSKRYGHAARHLKSCEYLAKRIDDWAGHPDHDAWVTDLRLLHGRKAAFWNA